MPLSYSYHCVCIINFSDYPQIIAGRVGYALEFHILILALVLAQHRSTLYCK